MTAEAQISSNPNVPCAFLAGVTAFRNRQFGKGIVAVVLGLACFSYATVSSLGFVSTSRDTAVAARTADADVYGLAKAKADAAATELKALAAAPAGNKKTEAARAKRRGELEGAITAAETVMSTGHVATVADPTAAAIVAYAAALGLLFKVESLPPWLSLLSVVFFELGAATSLIVLAALQPALSAAPVPASESNTEPASLPGKQRGRKPAAPFEKVISRLNEAGGRIEGPLRGDRGTARHTDQERHSPNVERAGRRWARDVGYVGGRNAGTSALGAATI